MASNQDFVLPPVSSFDLQSLPDERSKTLYTLLQRNHQNHAVLSGPKLIFHDHMPHMLGSAYLLGYPCDKLIEMYQNESSQLKSLNDGLIRTGITKDNWRQLLGKKKYTAAYTTFFDQELANTPNDWKTLVNEYLFTPPQPLINGFIGGPLSLGCTDRDPIHHYLDSPYPDTSTYKTTSAKEILHCVHTDTRFSNLFSVPGFINIATTFAHAGHALLEQWNAWGIINPAEQFRDVVDLAGLLLIESRNGEGEYDVFLAHLLTIGHASRVLLPSFPWGYRVGVLRQFWLFVLYVYVAQLRPGVGEGGDVGGVELRGRDWGWVYERCLEGGMLEEWKNEKDGWCLRAAVSFLEGFRGWTGFGVGVESVEVEE
ncbi:hypothetical protein BDV33DRAFT_228533 [Aspergillus novoparasiticus]|uniref:DUF4243 domain-containing protein n=1 Tax=Aspergillus novoparasiticus TaxID=986946 RepID=A0A5N6F2G9_9EURO|nr:hypothetical protein BDV33DRAFT_228533 [Aspergillus novoparasiticus]